MATGHNQPFVNHRRFVESRMYIIVFLFILMLGALTFVSLLDRKQRQESMRRLEQRRLRLQVEELSDLVACLEYTIPNRAVAKAFNQRMIEHLQILLSLEKNNKSYIEAALNKAEIHSQRLANPDERWHISYQRDSDAQISQTQTHMANAIELLPQLAAQGLINESELTSFTQDLRWGHLMVQVMSLVAQGNKSMTISDRFTAHAFYRKAQTHLLESLHQDPRRLQMIKELSQMIDGSRTRLSHELSPEDEPLSSLAS